MFTFHQGRQPRLKLFTLLFSVGMLVLFAVGTPAFAAEPQSGSATKCA